MNNKLYACIMAGGTGSRFWPESTVARPKQLLAIGCDRPMLRVTMDRIAPLIDHGRQLVVTGDAIVEAVRQTVPELPADNIISEPLRRNTAPCILLAAKLIHARDPEGVMCVLPSDHLIGRSREFLAVLEAAGTLAAQRDALITLGITADYPETGYGYIEFGDPAGNVAGRTYHRVVAFAEKPDMETAKEYLSTKRFFWNSGMFVWSVRAILRAMQTYLPDLVEAFAPIDDVHDSDELHEAIKRIYPEVKGVSIDYGVMEKADNIFGFPADIGWNDVGSWSSLEQLLEPDAAGNIHQGQFVGLDSTDCIISAGQGLAVALGVQDLIIVHTPRATLVCHKSRAQQIKKIFDILTDQGLEKYL